jgi:hypothetical protein
MKIKPEELSGNGFELLDELGHKELVPFIRKYMNKRTLASIIYYVSNILIFGLVGFYFVIRFEGQDYSFADRFVYFSYGLAIAFALIPLHEYLHVLAYKSQGAKKTSYDANLRKFYFMALADKFVANKKEFRVVALTPFIVITGLSILFLFFVNPDWRLTISGALLAHTSMCAGDFGLLSYFELHKNREIVTYDDVEKSLSYFYARNKD